MVEIQNGKCAICGAAQRLDRAQCVDHSHATGAVRGILCDECNKGLGCFKDDTELLRKAAYYLEQNKDYRIK